MNKSEAARAVKARELYRDTIYARVTEVFAFANRGYSTERIAMAIFCPMAEVKEVLDDPLEYQRLRSIQSVEVRHKVQCG